MSAAAPAPEEERLLSELHEAIRRAPSRPTGIEVGVALSIALGRRRSAVACGGCSTPLEFDGIPAATNQKLSSPFRLVFDRPERS